MEQPERPAPMPEVVGTLGDGGLLYAVNLYCLEKPRSVSDGQRVSDYYGKTKTVKGYAGFELCMLFDAGMPQYPSDNANARQTIQKEELEYVQRKSAFIVDKYNEYVGKLLCEWPCFNTAYVNGEVVITCDKVLFDELPGTNLDRYFDV